MVDVIICLGNKLNTSISMNDMRLRAEKAIELCKAGRARKIIFTGGSTASFGNFGGGEIELKDEEDNPLSEAGFMASIALNQGIPKKDIILEKKALTTIENAKYCKEIMFLQKFCSAIIVTSKYHVPRTKQIFTRIMSDAKLEFKACGNNRNLVQLIQVYFDEIIGLLKNMITGIK